MTRRQTFFGWLAALCGVRAMAQQPISSSSTDKVTFRTIGDDDPVAPAVQFNGTIGFGYYKRQNIKPENGQCPRCGWHALKLTKAFMDKRIERMTLLMSQPEHPGALEYYHGSKPKVLMECAECRNAFVQYAE